MIALNCFETLAGWVVIQFEITGEDRYSPDAFDSNLSRTKNVSGWMQTDLNIVHFDRLTEFQKLVVGTPAKPELQQPCTLACGNYDSRSTTSMIGMGVRDDRSVNATNRIDVKIASRAIQAC